MKIIQCSPEMSTDRMYCPSTDEVIFAPDYEEINENAEAFIAYWHGEVLDQPSITDEKLKTAWDEYFEKWKDSEDIDIWDSVEKFLTDYKNPNWIVYECTFHGMACGPVSTTVYIVVKADTVIQANPNIDNEGEEIAEKTEKEIEDEIIARQIRSLLR